MKCFNIIGIISVIQIKIGSMNTLFVYLYIHQLITESNATPAFIDTLINPFFNLFTYIGLPVQKRELDQEIMADVREVSDFDVEIPAKVVEIVDPNANSKDKPWFTSIEHFECGPEIPIVLIDKGQQTLILRSTGGANEFQWKRYKKVSEMRIKTEYGYDKTFEQFLVEASQMKEPTAPLRYRPIPTMIQVGLGETSAKPVTFPQINNETQSLRNQSNTCNPCEDENVKTRPNFPVYTSKPYGFY